MKKLMIFVCTFILALSLTACNTDSTMDGNMSGNNASNGNTASNNVNNDNTITDDTTSDPSLESTVDGIISDVT